VVLGGFREVRQFFLHGGLIWGIVSVVLGGFRGVRQLSFMGADLVHCVGGFRWFLRR
jgi:hypothetical protein